MVYRKSSFFLLVLCIILGFFYIQPKIQKRIELEQNKVVAKNCENVVEYILSEYKLNNKINLEKTLDSAIEKFSTVNKNPVNSKKSPYSKSPDFGACSSEYDAKTKTVTITGLGADNSIIVRFVLNPPSFVRYDRD